MCVKRGQRFGRGVIRGWEPASARLSPPGWKEPHKKGRRSWGRVCGRRAARARERMRIRPAGSRRGHGSVRAPWPWNSGSAAYVSAKAVTAGSVAVAAGPDGSLPGMHRCFGPGGDCVHYVPCIRRDLAAGVRSPAVGVRKSRPGWTNRFEGHDRTCLHADSDVFVPSFELANR